VFEDGGGNPESDRDPRIARLRKRRPSEELERPKV
jgi:hypothetical protein